ncbi:alpha/beta fold hydrolase [Sulfitobacter aestuariivivens]|uniref:alpha/beta fold hydrolase n=1 Tax=Sulfitobacter aestuariivivens TaxID=2766981 RepID=UPI00361CFD49
MSLRESIGGLDADMRVVLHPWETYLAGLDVPIHFIHGKEDQITRLQVIERLAQSLPQARLNVLENRGNLTWWRDVGQILTSTLGT